MGFAVEIAFVLKLVLLVLGPRRLRAILGRVVQANAKVEEA